jgi:hypothetical protein
MIYFWDSSVGRYRGQDGRFVARSTIDSFVSRSLAASRNVSDTLGQLVSNGLVNVDDWKLSFRQEIKDEYIRQYLTGKGGLEQMISKDWGSIGGMLKEQYGYLDGFAQDIAAGNLSEAQIMARSDMYINSASEALERAKERVATSLGFDLVEWVVDTSLENCDDCLNFQSMGVVPVDEDPYDGAYPGSGDTQCLTNCGCHLEYSNSDSGEEYAY